MLKQYTMQKYTNNNGHLRFEIFTVVTEECRLLGCYASWLL
jgi:hypothetical protein